eukprot:sb/3472018/
MESALGCSWRLLNFIMVHYNTVKMATAEVENPSALEELKEVKETIPPVPKKHPLENAWTLWFFKEERDKDWIECYKKVASFETVEDFWALYNFIMPPTRLGVKCEYSVFKDGINPMWEDPRNCEGGKWRYNMLLKQQGNLDMYWKEMVKFCGVLILKPENKVWGFACQCECVI